MSDGSAELDAAIYGVLSGASPAIAEGGVHDDVPEDVTFPYVEMGESDAVDDDVTCSDGLDETVTLHIWSRYRGKKETKEIMSRIRDLLHNKVLAVSGRSSAHSWVTSSRVVRDPDGLTRHGIVLVRVVHHA